VSHCLSDSKEVLPMTKDEYWQKFEKTGSITDYLDYTASNGSLNERNISSEQRSSSGEDLNNTYAGFNMYNRNDS